MLVSIAHYIFLLSRANGFELNPLACENTAFIAVYCVVMFERNKK